MRTITVIRTAAGLRRFREENRMRPNWHEPDEQGVDAFPAVGTSFDNASADPLEFEVSRAVERDDDSVYAFEVSVLPAASAKNPRFPRGVAMGEHGVVLFRDYEPVAFVNLADLLAFASGHEGDGEDEEVEVPWR